MDPLLIQTALYLGAALLAVPLAARTGLGSVLGFLAAGLLIAPIMGLVGSESEHLRSFGEYGIAMMLFLVGLESSPRALWNLRHKLVGLGGSQVLVTTAVVAAGARLLGESWSVALSVGMILAPSSTALVVQTLAERRLLSTSGGQSAFAVLLTQDLAIILMLAILPLLAGGAAMASGEDHATLMTELPAWAAAVLTVGAVAAVILSGTFLTRPAFRWTAHAHLREIDTALALFVVVSITVLMEFVGLSPAFGTFLGGVVLAGSEYRHRLETDLQPFKGLLLGLFFIGIGAGIDVERLLAAPLQVIVLTLAVVAVKAVILLGLALLFRLGGQDRWVFTLGLAQGGEFGFILVGYGLSLRLVDPSLAQMLLLVIALSMVMTPIVFLFLDGVLRRQPQPIPESEPVAVRHSVIIAGSGRFGRNVNRVLRSAGQHAVLLDNDLNAIEEMRGLGHFAFLGDPTRPEVLEAAGLAEAQVLVVALDDPMASVRLVAAARQQRPHLCIIARAFDSQHAHALVHAGADETLQEVFDAALRAGRVTLEALGLGPEEAARIEGRFVHLDRLAIKELASLWRPNVPAGRNTAYTARRRAIEDEFKARDDD